MHADRYYQTAMKSDTYRSWDAGNNAVLAVAPCGSGKTHVMAGVTREVNEPTALIAHRQELIQQISIAHTRLDIPHNIIAPEPVIRAIIKQQVAECGMSYFSLDSGVTVAGVDTIAARSEKLRQWASTVRLWQGDEGHHFLSDNKWGRAVDMFPRARGIGYTATPLRCDRKSLRRDQGGVFDDMVIGPTPRQLINENYLADYRIFGPPQSIDRDAIKVSAKTGEFTQQSLRDVNRKSTITGDIVQHYQRFAAGKRGITFVVDVETATRTAEAYNAAGIPAEVVSAKTPDAERNAAIGRFRAGTTLQLVNVDLFGEGFDVPAVEVVSMGRPTESLGLYIQQFMRCMRPAPGKTHGIIIDHVGNVKRHGLPDSYVNWSLHAPERGNRSVRDPNALPVRTCLACFSDYEATTNRCPWCGHIHEPSSRSAPEYVDGDLVEFSPDLIAELRGQIAAIDAPFSSKTDVPNHLNGTPAERSIARRFGERQLAQGGLRECIAYWAGIRRDQGMSDSEIYRRFYHRFGVDVLSAQAIRETPKIKTLTAQIMEGYWV